MIQFMDSTHGFNDPVAAKQLLKKGMELVCVFITKLYDSFKLDGIPFKIGCWFMIKKIL